MGADMFLKVCATFKYQSTWQEDIVKNTSS